MISRYTWTGLIVALLGLANVSSAQTASASNYVFDVSPREGERNYRLLPDDFHVYSGERYRPPVIPNNDSYETNHDLIEHLSERSLPDAIDVWLAAVSGGFYRVRLRDAPPELPNGKPTWDYWAGVAAPGEGTNRWTYSVPSTRSSEGAAAGNFNYGVTGMALIGGSLRRAGVPNDLAEFAARWALRIGAGVRELGDYDTPALFFSQASPGVTPWLDDREGARHIEHGMMYERFLRLQKAAESVGVVLDPETFGIRSWEREAPWILSDAPYTPGDAIRRTQDHQRDEERRRERERSSRLEREERRRQAFETTISMPIP